MNNNDLNFSYYNNFENFSENNTSIKQLIISKDSDIGNDSDFEELFTRLVQQEVRRNYFNTSVDNTVNNIMNEFEEAYDQELQQIIWNSIYGDENS